MKSLCALILQLRIPFWHLDSKSLKEFYKKAIDVCNVHMFRVIQCTLAPPPHPRNVGIASLFYRMETSSKYS